MTTKFKVIVNSVGNHSDSLLKIIGNHNAGIATVNLEDLAGYVKSRVCEYPTLFADVVKPDADENALHICKNKDEQPYLTIQECIYEELQMSAGTELGITDVVNISQQGEQC